MYTSRFPKGITLITVLFLTLSSVQPALAAPPSNDFFANAESIAALPLNATVDMTEATTESNEPQACWFMERTVWYSFTPSQNMTVHANTIGSAISSNLNVYHSTGSGINSLDLMGCASFGSSPTFFFEAGQTYYLQAGSIFGETGNIQVNLEQFTPAPPQVSFYFYPSPPSAFDTVSFCDSSFDPAGLGFNSLSWDFGDGGTSTDNCASHQYGKDGDYLAQHSVTTVDGRSGSSSQLVQVRTHDVSISSIVAPKSATVGQTKAITVSLRNTRYPETISLELSRSVAGGGFQVISTSIQFIPVRSGNRTTPFVFNYTFTPQDAQTGKVTFRAIVQIQNANDAFPADNQGFSTPPTVVKR